jgi:hypothetical protein
MGLGVVVEDRRSEVLVGVEGGRELMSGAIIFRVSCCTAEHGLTQAAS